MGKILINTDRCVGCALCVKDCVANHLVIENNKAAVKEGSCIECGHCYAICPSGAVEMEGYDSSNCENFTSFEEIDSKTLLEAIKSRRTIRQFLNKEVEEEKIQMILEAGRYAPTAANSQKVAYTILKNSKAEIEGKCVKMFRGATKAGGKLISALGNFSIDDNFFFKGAPLVIIVSATSDVNGTLASAYMELMANSLGLGVLYSGFFQACTKISKSLLGKLKLPKGHKVVTCMIIGYPAVKYQRQAPRKPLNVKEI